ncbi:tRNA pseudouridine(38/39) synthase-like [Sinocyclocheilus rhinocerous]|uniref:tRNA pseudouridine(38/39) synthase-like n=1 Tax=Sinocyclocheilus rhinocerous TaxID=307959 RepID=UPI0007B78DD1|nr:PREDICTED: tRNA pseudouridine(38/39) synthase-like [Sinocyclocheilus rhinocerous]
MSEEVLLARVKALEEEVERLKAQLKIERDGAGTEERTQTSAILQTESSKHQEGGENRSKQKKQGAERPFDFSAYPRRHVALRLAYLGWQYQGFAVQENTDNTVEARLFEALLQTKLIQDRQTSTYHRCGRTDKGVSAFSQGSHKLYVFQVKGLAFLYHQVRCMMALLLHIGQKLEAPEIIDQLLDVEKNPRKPQYSMAVDYPLVLYDCHFEGVNWRNETEEENHVLNSLHQHWVQNAVKTQVLLGMIQGLQKTNPEMTSLHCWLMEGSRQRKYQPLLDRPRCESLESRIQHFVKRGRLEQEEGENGEETTVFRGKRSKHSHLTTTNQIQEQNHGAKTEVPITKP